MDTQVLVCVRESGADAERLADLADKLRTELLALDVNDVRLVGDGAAPPGSRGMDVAAVGALLASLNGSATALGHLVRTVRSWLGRGGTAPRTVELTVGDKTLRVTNASGVQQDRLVEAFIAAVTAEG